MGWRPQGLEGEIETEREGGRGRDRGMAWEVREGIDRFIQGERGERRREKRARWDRAGQGWRSHTLNFVINVTR